MDTGKYSRYTTCFILFWFFLLKWAWTGSSVPMDVILPSSNPSWSYFCSLKKLAVCSSLESPWHSLVVFVTTLFSVCGNEEWVSNYLNVKTQIQISRPFHITGCFEFWAQLLQATMLERTTWLCHYFLVKVHSRHDEPSLNENSFILMPYNGRLYHRAKEIELTIPLRIFPVKGVYKVTQTRVIVLYTFYVCCFRLGWNWRI